VGVVCLIVCIPLLLAGAWFMVMFFMPRT